MKRPIEFDPPFVAVVTGSSSGIGQAIAIEFASRGADVLVHGRSHLAGLQQTLSVIRSLHRDPQSATQLPDRTRCVVADLRSSPSILELERAAFAWRGYVNVWIHAAGADVLTGSAGSMNFIDKLSALWETDVAGTVVLSRRVAHSMLQRGVPHATLPSIVHIGWDQSDAGMEGDSGQYFAPVKAAIAAFSKSLAKSVAPKIRVNCVAPGWIQTEWGRDASDAWDERARSESLLERWGTPVDVARVVTAISMGDGEFINGQTLHVNGGWCGSGDSVRSRMTYDPR